MLTLSSRLRWTTCLFAPLSAVVLALATGAPVHAATSKTVTEAPQPSFVLPVKPSEMLRAPVALWKPVLAKLDAALDQRDKATDLLGKPALIELNVRRTVLSQMQQDWPAVFEAVKKTRQLQASESARQTAGLLNEVLARQAVSGGDAVWLQRHLRDQVLAMPWTEVESTIRNLRQQLVLMKSESIEGYVVNKLDLSAGVTENRASLGFVMQVLAMRFQLLEVMPRQNALIAGLDEAIAQRSPAADAASTVGK